MKSTVGNVWLTVVVGVVQDARAFSDTAACAVDISPTDGGGAEKLGGIPSITLG